MVLINVLDLSPRRYVAMHFMLERGCVVTEGRRTFPASKALFEDAMIEYCYLRDLPY